VLIQKKICFNSQSRKQEVKKKARKNEQLTGPELTFFMYSSAFFLKGGMKHFPALNVTVSFCLLLPG